MDHDTDFDLQDFIPYLLNQAADATSQGFAAYYKSRYGMLRTEWRVVFHLGRYGALTAKDICGRANIHKTKVSRAVRALEAKRYLKRQEHAKDRRHETLELTAAGATVFEDLVNEARRFNAALLADVPPDAQAQLNSLLRAFAQH